MQALTAHLETLVEMHSGVSTPTVTYLDGGGYVVSWIGANDDHPEKALFFQRFDDNGNKVGAETLVVALQTNQYIWPSKMCALDGGGFAISWQFATADGAPGSGIYTQSFNALGVSTTAATSYISNDGRNIDQSIARLPGGGYVMVYNFFDLVRNIYEIRTLRYDANGHPAQHDDGFGNLINDDLVIGGLSPGATGAWQPEAVPLAGGGFAVTWIEGHTVGYSAGEVRLQLFSSSNQATSASIIVSPITEGYEPDIATLADGSMLILWGVSENPGQSLHAEHFAANGAAIGSEFIVVSKSQGLREGGKVTALNDGGYVIAWGSQLLDSAHRGTLIQRYDASGHTIGDELLVSGYYNVELSALASGGFVAVSGYENATTDHTNLEQTLFTAGLTPTNGQDVLYGTENADTTDALGGDDTVFGLDGDDSLTGGAGHDVLYGDAGNDTLNGGADDDHLLGGDGDDRLLGGAGLDVLDGGTGADRLYGGSGDDTYLVDNVGDKIIEYSGTTDTGGNDIVLASVRFTLGLYVENLTLTGNDNLIGTGNELDNHLAGNSGSNKLYGMDGADHIDGSAGADFMYGGAGNDVYIVDNAGDRAYEVVSGVDSGGTDTVYSSVSFALSAGLENLILTADAISATGNDTDNSLTGNSANNTLQGLGGNDYLDGGTGADRMFGGAGNDTYIVDDAGDRAYEVYAGVDSGGVDSVYSSVSFALGAGIENLVLSGSAVVGYGNGSANSLTGTSGNNTLKGLGGDDVLDGAGGTDVMYGGSGNDIYVVDNAGDKVSEQSTAGVDDGGIDTVDTSVSLTLGKFIENMTLTGDANINGAGNELNNVLIGNNGNNVLNGGTGADTMAGGAGNDAYYVDNAADVTIETSGNGTDKVLASVSFILSDNVENLTLIGADAVNGTGNGLNNVIAGNDGANLLAGGAGNDTLTGGLGADTFLFNAFGTANGVDHVKDFSSGTDHLQFHGADFGFDAGHFLMASELSLSGSATGANAQFVFNTTTHVLYWDSNGGVAGGLTAICVLDTTATISTTDFLFT